MRILIFFTSILLIVFMAPAFAQKVNTDYDKTFDFSTVKTYAWKEGHPVPNPLVHQRILDAIDSNLAAKGLTKTDANPDLYVAYAGSTKEDVQIDEWGYGGWRYGGNRNIDVRRILIGMLVVDLITPDNKLVWRGVGSDTVSDNPEKNEKKINEAAKKMFEKFPPKKK
jgi:hypothetical protein